MRGDPRRARARLTAAAAAVIVALLAGCAEVPSTGLVQATPVPQGGTGVNGSALIMSPPQPGWSPTQIVSGFLLASASFAHGNAIAREYLTPQASKLWQPGSAVTIVDQLPTVVAQPARAGPDSTVTVMVSGRELATVTSSGQYRPVAGDPGTAQRQEFVVSRLNGEWRIASLPGGAGVSHALLLPAGFFPLVYMPQNLYFYARTGASRVLVPDPVFVPSESSDPTNRLVTALMAGVPGWLQGAAVSAFPPRTRLLQVQVLPGPPGGKTAIVSLGMPAQSARYATLRALDAQLVWTLTSHSYGPPLIQAVKLKVNGHIWPSSGSTVLGSGSYRDWVPQSPPGEPLYYVAAGNRVRVLARDDAASSAPVPGAAGQVPMTAIAVSRDRKYLAGIGSGGRTVLVANIGAAAGPHARPSASTPQVRLTGSAFTTPSWDSAGNLWVAGRVGREAGVWVLLRGAAVPLRVSVPASLGSVTAVRMAADGSRIAMIVGQGSAAHLVIGAIVDVSGGYTIPVTLPVGPNLSDVSAVTWYDPDNLLAITGPADARQIWEVPVNGNDAARQGAVQTGIVSIAAAGQDNPLYLGLASARLERSSGFGEFWSDITSGQDMTYPG